MSSASCAPDVWLIRHGNKNVTVGGLNQRGWRRASWLASLVRNGTWPKFTALYATDSSRADHMIRERQTIEEMSAVLDVPIDESFGKDEMVPLARAARAAALHCGPVLVVWEHCRIPAIAMEMDCHGSAACRACWSDDNFGEVLRINAANGKAVAFDEGFAGDDWDAEVTHPSFAGYECTDAQTDAHCGSDDGTWHCPCRFPDGMWSGYPRAQATPAAFSLVRAPTARGSSLLDVGAAPSALVAVGALIGVWMMARRRREVSAAASGLREGLLGGGGA